MRWLLISSCSLKISQFVCGLEFKLNWVYLLPPNNHQNHFIFSKAGLIRQALTKPSTNSVSKSDLSVNSRRQRYQTSFQLFPKQTFNTITILVYFASSEQSSYFLIRQKIVKLLGLPLPIFISWPRYETVSSHRPPQNNRLLTTYSWLDSLKLTLCIRLLTPQLLLPN